MTYAPFSYLLELLVHHICIEEKADSVMGSASNFAILTHRRVRSFNL